MHLKAKPSRPKEGYGSLDELYNERDQIAACLQAQVSADGRF